MKQLKGPYSGRVGVEQSAPRVKSKDRRPAPRPFRVKGDYRATFNNFFNALAIDLKAAPARNDHVRFAVERQLKRMRKRCELSDTALKGKAVNDFVALNASLPGRPVWIEPEILHEAREFIRVVLEKGIKRFLPDSLQECFSWNIIYDSWRFGPKASYGVDGIGVVEKIDQPMTTTRSAAPYVQRLRANTFWIHATDCMQDSEGILEVGGSRLTTVLKNEEQWRTIAVEPSGNMALQLGGAHIVETALRAIGLDIRKQQPKNQLLARRSSIDGRLATIDLKSASDMRTRLLVQALWPDEWFRFSEIVRSPAAHIPEHGVVELNMTSTMGNGLTFPMMTLELLALVYANRRIKHNGPRLFIDWATTAVFGDDIIVPSEEYQSLCNVLEGAGYVVNHDKSFSSGKFRESCGGDYFDGYDVTPFYARSIRTIPDTYVVINQLTHWAGKHEIPVFRALKVLRDWLPGKPYFVPEWYPETSGVRTANLLYHNGKRSFKYLRCCPVKRQYNGMLHSMLVVGGYLEQNEDGDFEYTPHADEYVFYRSDKARLSLNYLDGWDPYLRNSRWSTYASLLVSSM